MSQLITYLSFNGNCRDAMHFYQHCLGGELYLQTIGDTPVADGLPEEVRGCILHSFLKKDGLVLMGTDMVGDETLVQGNAMSILLECSSRQEMLRYFEKLSEGANKSRGIEQTHWGALFGSLTDKFGYRWLLKCSKFQNP